MATLDGENEWQRGTYGPDNCPLVLEVHDSGETKKLSLCGGVDSYSGRQRDLYLSSSQSLHVAFSVEMPGFNSESLPHFVVNYQGKNFLIIILLLSVSLKTAFKLKILITNSEAFCLLF